MSDCEKIHLIDYHFVNTVKCTLIKQEKNTKSYINKLTACNICILANIISIFPIRTVIGVLYSLNLAVAVEALIIIIMVTAYISLGGLTIVKIRLTRKILTISKQFNIHMNKICAVFIILIIIDVNLYISYYAMLPDIEIIVLLAISTLSMFFAGIIIGIEIIYKVLFITDSQLVNL